MLYVHRSERADYLVQALGDVLAQPLADPMAREVVAVPTRGVERWLTQRLSHRLGAGAVPDDGVSDDGVCANIEYPSPGALVALATSAALGLPSEDDPWAPDRLVWPLLELVDDRLHEEALEPLAAHLRAASPAGPQAHPLRRFATLHHLAELYEHYAINRPQMVLSWLSGARAGECSWQADLWRHLREKVGVPSPAERLEAAWAKLKADPSAVDLPPRLCLFGLTRLPKSHMATFEALGAQRDVHMFLLHPSSALWDTMAALPAPRPSLPRDEDRTGGLATNPLLRSWGRDSREMQLVLSAHGARGGQHRAVAAVGPVGSLLERVQDDIRNNREPPGPPALGAPDLRPPLSPADDSLRVHACHGKLRQVEVVRDAVLHLLARDPSLEPRDIIVMCPDIEAFAPLVQAVFGTAGVSPGPGETGPPELRVRLADRSLRQTNPLLGVAAHLLELAGSRVTASQVLEFASRDAVSRRFDFDEVSIAQIQRWVAGAGMRWGLDGEHREPWGLGGVEANTWRAGLDRLLLGVVMTEEVGAYVSGVLPFDDVPGSSTSLVGRLAEMVSRLSAAVRALRGPQPVGQWVSALLAATEALAEADPAETWQRDQLHAVLDEVAGHGHRSPALLDLAEARFLLAGKLRGRPTRANFRTGDLTVCTLVPMRSVPHRVVCLMGLDSGEFPRHAAEDGDDLLLAAPLVGDPDARSEDRQLLLDAILAATEHLVITFQGRDPRTNQPCPPAVPVDELLDVIERTVQAPPGGPPARDLVLVSHPLQVFDPHNFSPELPWGFDAVNLDGARSLLEQKHHRGTPSSWKLPPLGRDAVQLDALVRFLEHPVRAFLRERLNLYPSSKRGLVPDEMPVELDGLARWDIGERLLKARLAGKSEEEAELAELGRGFLPPGPLATAELAKVRPAVAALVGTAASHSSAQSRPQTVQVDFRLPDGRPFSGTITGLRGRTLVRCLYSRLGPKHRIAAWARLVALRCGLPDLDTCALTIGRGPDRSDGDPLIATSLLGPLTTEEALEALQILVDLYDRGMCEPLPLYCATSEQWAAARRRDSDPFEPAKSKWETVYDVPGEDQDEDHVLVLGGVVGFRQLLSTELPPDSSEVGPGWATEDGRFGRYARRLWDPLLSHEQFREFRASTVTP
jgi:exodeoxyribonuclease V gamma subunit